MKICFFRKFRKKMKILEKFWKFFKKSKFSKSFKSFISDRRMFFHIFFSRRIWDLKCLLLSLKLKRNSGTLWILLVIELFNYLTLMMMMIFRKSYDINENPIRLLDVNIIFRYFVKIQTHIQIQRSKTPTRSFPVTNFEKTSFYQKWSFWKILKILI